MTVEELLASKELLLKPRDVGSLLGIHPQTINLKAKNGTLEFPFIRSGNRTKIPRIPLMQFLGLEVKKDDESRSGESDH